MSVEKVILRKTAYKYPERTVGYHLEEIRKDDRIGFSLQFHGHLVEDHYVLQMETNPPSPPFGVAHTREEAQRRTYEKALREGRSLATRRGLPFEDQTKQTSQTS